VTSESGTENRCGPLCSGTDFSLCSSKTKRCERAQTEVCATKNKTPRPEPGRSFLCHSFYQSGKALVKTNVSYGQEFRKCLDCNRMEVEVNSISDITLAESATENELY
jgi:hypothetical protein